MEKIVEEGYKIDLHIHSIYSSGKDKNKVKYNTLEHIPVLASKLNENGVQICALTDHDAFNLEMYTELKKLEVDKNSKIEKVLPGIEFSVVFTNEEQEENVVHVIAIFNDENNEKITHISDCLNNDNGKIDYDKHEAFSEEKFINILKKINLDTVLIAHQKNTLTSAKVRKSDANSVGKERFKEFVYTDYFEAFEFRNKKNEIFNKSYVFNNNIEENVRFITGSDCHNWSEYPKENSGDNSEFIFTYVKCLPTFRGLVMAITDYRRIKLVSSFFDPTASYVPSIEMNIGGTDISVPLSRGLNVIIGDNSIGKSMLLHKLTGYKKKSTKDLKPGIAASYDRYLKTQRIKVTTEINETDLFYFDMQGEVRRKFEEGLIKSDEFFSTYYPPSIRPEQYRTLVDNELKKAYEYLYEKFQCDNLKSKLGKIKLLDRDEQKSESISFIRTMKKDNKKIEAYESLISEISTVKEKISNLLLNVLIADDDLEYLKETKNKLYDMTQKYKEEQQKIKLDNIKIGIFQECIRDYKQRYETFVSDEHKIKAAFSESRARSIENIVELISRKRKNKMFVPDITENEVEVNSNKVFEYEFNSKLNVDCISNEYIFEVISSVLKKGSEIEWMQITQKDLANMLPYYENGESLALTELKSRINGKLDEDFTPKFTITCKGMEKTQELSSGFNAQIYFNILSYENENKGVYIIDQPEDNISQNAIREYLLERFKTMGERRQVIIVTHNPQFILNLDVDNVVYLGKEDDEFVFKSGALEFKDENYDMLEIIAEHVEGGLNTLKKRWKRYEKSSSI